MPQAALLFRSTVAYRRDAFARGLETVGFEVTAQPRREPRADDLLIIWNRRGSEDRLARRYEQAGARVIVAENGYIGHDESGGKLYALALGYHNGAGKWRVGGPERWDGFGIEVKPWRESGRFVLLLPQRGIGPLGVGMPQHWVRETTEKLSRITDREIRIRRHPGPTKTEPYDALAGAHAAVTWGSGAAIKAIVAGVPVFYGMRNWIGAAAAWPFDPSAGIEEPFLGDRRPMLERLAWAQWRLSEIESGEAFAWLLGL